MTPTEALYIELGKAVAQGHRHRQVFETIRDEHDARVAEEERRYRALLAENNDRQTRSQNRIDELHEAIRLCEQEGMDPVQAKLVAKESLEDRKASDPFGYQHSLKLVDQYTSINNAVFKSGYV